MPSKKHKNFLWIFVIGLPLISIPVLNVSCLWTNKEPEPINIITKKELTEKQKNISKETVKKKRAVLITDTGKVDDKSFNQSAQEGANEFFKQLLSQVVDKTINNKKDLYFYINSYKEEYDVVKKNYQYALDSGIEIWILPGFKHNIWIRKFWAENKEEIKKKKIMFVTIDFDASVEMSGFEPIDSVHLYSFLFDVQEAAFIAGYAASDFLTSTFTDKDERVLATFGGAPNFGVTDFVIGFLQGIRYYNKNNDLANRVKMYSKEIKLNLGFLPSEIQSKETIFKNAIQNSKAKIVFPVAGPATGNVLKELTKEKQWVIGVDTDQSKIYENYKHRFFTSVTKEVSQQIYNFLYELYNSDDVPDNLKTDFLKQKGWDDKWTAVIDSENSKIQASLDKAKKIWTTEKTKIKAEKISYGQASGNQELANKIATDINDLFENKTVNIENKEIVAKKQ